MSEFAFRQAPPRNREIVSCRACVRAVNVGWKCTSNVMRRVFPFPFWRGGLSLFPCESAVCCSEFQWFLMGSNAF